MKALYIIFSVLLLAQSAVAQSEGFERISNSRLLAPAPVDREVEVVDGDTIWMGIHQIRLYGIDAFEPKQPCDLAGRAKTYCHTSASELLRTFTRRPDFRCEIHVRGENKPWVRYGRYVASCYAGEIDVSRELVRQGWAYADRHHGESFLADERLAIDEGLGIHTTGHQTPWDWRRSQRSPSDCMCE